MKLTSEQLDRAYRTFMNFDGSSKDSLGAAIEEFIDTMLTPGELIVGEAIPQRDYRKELWIGVATAVANGLNAVRNGVAFDRANEALAAFDKIFPKETDRG